MASDLDERKISELVREAIAAELTEHGETTPGAIPLWIRAKYPGAVSTYSEQLFDAAISRKASGQLRSWFAVSMAGETQLSLPGIPADVLSEIPPTITVPDGKNEPRHVLLSRVSLGEFRAWERMLAEQIKADQRKHRAARFIVSKASGLDLSLREAFGVTEAA